MFVARQPTLDDVVSRDNLLSNQRAVRRDELCRYLGLNDNRSNDVFGPLRRFIDYRHQRVGRTLWLCTDHILQMKQTRIGLDDH